MRAILPRSRRASHVVFAVGAESRIGTPLGHAFGTRGTVHSTFSTGFINQAASGPDGGIQDESGNFGTPMNGIITKLPGQEQ